MNSLLVKPNRWSCLATSFAMAFGITTEQFYDIAGHDGSEIIFPKLEEPRGRRGFHISEAVVVGLKLGFTCTPVELHPAISNASGSDEHEVFYGPDGTEELNLRIFDAMIDASRGVIECTTRQRNWHAIAFDKGVIYDPDGRTFPYTPSACEVRNLFMYRLWSVQKVKA